MNDIKEFYDSVSKDLSEKYSKFEFQLDEDRYEIHDDVIQISINSHALYSMYANNEIPYNGGVLGTISYMIDSKIDEFYNDIEYSRIYPILRHKDWNINYSSAKFLKRRLFLDIDVLFTKGYGNEYQCIKEKHDLSFKEIEENSWKNINNLENRLVKLNDELDLFYLDTDNIYACSMLFNSKVEDEIRQKIGVNFIFSIPSNIRLVIAANTPTNILILKEVISRNDDSLKVGNKVYGYINGEYQYMD